MNRMVSKLTGVLLSAIMSQDKNNTHKQCFFAIAAMISFGLIPAGLQGQATESFSHPEAVSSGLGNWQMQQFGDYTIQDALARISGVQVGNRGEVNLRGVGYQRFNVTVDGQQLGSTGYGDRSVDLHGIPVDLIRELEFIKVLRPDMNANALAGVINLKTHPNVVNERVVSIRVGGGANTQYFDLTGVASQASLYYAEPLRENLSLSVNVSFHQDYGGREGVESEYRVADFESGPVDVLERVSPFVETGDYNRLGGGLKLTYQPSDRESYYIRGLINRDNREGNRYFDSWNVNGDWMSPDSTGLTGEQGSYGHTSNLVDVQSSHLAIQAGGTQVFENAVKLRFNAGWARSSVYNAQYEFPFLIDQLNHAINMNNRKRPSMTVTNFNLLADGSINRQFIIGQDFNRLIRDHTDDKLSANLDVDIPFGFGTVTFGSSALLTVKDARYDDSSLEFTRTLRLNRFNTLDERNFDILGSDYDIPWLLNTNDARSFLKASRPQFNRDDNLYREKSEPWNFEVLEQTYSGYGMTSIELSDNLTFFGGVRLEYTNSEVTGRNVSFDNTGEFTESTDTTFSSDDMQIFPNAQVIYKLLSETTVHIALSRSINRPDFSMLAPFKMVHARDSTISRGNTELKPMVSNNIDLQIDHRFNAGMIGLGLFGKQIVDFVYERERILSEEGLDGWSERTFQNGDEKALIYGVELSWQQNLGFLPGFLGNFGLYANYTWSESDYSVNFREDDVRLPGHSPHVINAALNYKQGRFSGQVAYHWSAEYIETLQQDRQDAPSIGMSTYYMDEYEQGWSDLSASLVFRISERFRFWANVENLLTPEQVRYQNTRNLYPVSVQYRGGRSFVSGIRYDF